MMDNGGLSVADALALERNGNCGCNNGYGFMGGDGAWIFFLFFLLACGGGWGRNGGWGNDGANSPNFQGVATRADINDGHPQASKRTG